MADFVTFTILGLSLGSIYAIAASGLVMTYSTSNIFNFSHGAVAMFSAYLYWQFRVGWDLPAPLAMFLILAVICPLIGIIFDKAIFQHLKNTLLSTQIVIPIALLLLMTGAATWIWASTPKPRILRPFWGATSRVKISIGDSFVNITYHQIAVLITSLALAGALYVLLVRTKLGISMRAVVDNSELIQLNGGSPRRISTSSWMIGTMLAGLAGILIASLQNRNLEIFALTLLVVNAFAAGIFGRLRSIPATFIGALILGLAVSYWNWVDSTIGSDWRWLTNFREAIPIVILFILLLAFPYERIRETVVARTKEQFSVPSLPKALTWSGVAIAVGFLVIPISEPSVIGLFGRVISLGIIALSIVVLTGYMGQINLAPLAFAGIAAIVVFQIDVGPTGSPFRESMSVWALLMATLICAAVGAIIALPVVRLKGIYLALATFSFAVIVSIVILNQRDRLSLNIPWVGDGEDISINLFSGGTLFIPRPRWFGIDFKNGDKYLILLIVFFCLVALGLVAMRRSRVGRKLSALKDSPAASATLGMNIVRYKVFIFALSSGIAGFGGALYSSQEIAVVADHFTIFNSLGLVLVVVVAGVGYISGAWTGGILFGLFFVMLTNTFNKLAEDYSAFEWLFKSVLGNFFFYVGIAFASVGLARSPGGFLNDTFEGYRQLLKPRGLPFLGGWIGLFAIWYLLRIFNVVNNWTFIIVLILSVVALPLLTERVLAKQGKKQNGGSKTEELEAQKEMREAV